MMGRERRERKRQQQMMDREKETAAYDVYRERRGERECGG